MKKLQEIDRLVEEATGAIIKAMYSSVTPADNDVVRPIFTNLAKKCAEINEQDWLDTAMNFDTAMNLDRVQLYNSRLREGQVEGLHPAIQHINAGYELTAETIKAINELAEVAYNTSVKPALQPLPSIDDLANEIYLNSLSVGLNICKDIAEHIILKYGTQPRKWWMDLKKGDKLIDETGKTRTFTGTIFLETGKHVISDVSKCTPYTSSPLDQLLSTFTPEQKALWEQVKEGKDE